MIVWIASWGRSGNTFFRVVMHNLYGVNTYAAFEASEVLTIAQAEALVGHKSLPPILQGAIAAGDPDQIRSALEELDASSELFVFKTHAMSDQLFGTTFPAILIVRDGRDAFASYANYLVDIRFDSAALRNRIGRIASSKRELLNRQTWTHLAKIMIMATAKKTGFRRWLVSRRIDRLLRENTPWYLDWASVNRSWLEREPKPVLVYFDELIRDPVGTVTQAVNELGIGLVPRESPIPSFKQLHNSYPSFFRRGLSGDWKNQFSAAQARLFLSKHGEMLRRLKFPL